MVANVVGSGRVLVPFVAEFNDFSSCPLTVRFSCFSRTSVGFRWILRAWTDSVTDVMGPCRDSTCCREKFRFLQVPSFLYFILLLVFFFFSLFIFFPLVAFSLRCRFVVFCFGCNWSRYLKLSIAWVATCRLGNAPARKRRVSFCSCLCCCCPGLQIHTAKYTQTHRHKHFSWNCRPFSLFGFNYMKMKSDFQYPSYNSVLYAVWLLYRHYFAETMRQFVGCSSSGCLAVSLMNSVFSS